MADYTCMIFGKDDAVLKVQSFASNALPDAIKEAVAMTLATEGTRGFQLWSAGKVVHSRLTKKGIPWTDFATAEV